MKHTQGEWKVIPCNGYQKCIGTDKYTICHTTIALEDKDKVQAEANAKLIAAAPDLLETLHNLLVYCRVNSTSQLEPLIRKADSAIKKATE